MPEKIDCIGTIMIDSFELLRDKIEADDSRKRYGLQPQGYDVVTLHRRPAQNHTNAGTFTSGSFSRHRPAGVGIVCVNRAAYRRIRRLRNL